ncbi:MAG TPA: hypothetical protein VK427_06100 [Kofleriaceae bacterium]|nr:hypothetical protein [Kofleriaceae bacterium]
MAAGCGDNYGSTTPPVVDAAIVDTMPPDACVPTTARGTVTRGNLAMDASQRAVFLDMEPPLDRSILFYSVRENEPSPRFGAITCELVPADTVAATPAGLSCRHESMGTDSVPPVPVTIHWQVVTFNLGVRVQRGLADTSIVNPQTVTLTAVDPAKSFVVLGGALSGGSGWGNNDFTIAQLKSGTSLEIRHNAPGSFVPWQVVEMDGAVVRRGTSSLTTAETMKTVPLTGVPGGSIVLATHTNDNPQALAASAMMLQATLNNGSLVLKRAMAGTAMEIAYEVITMPFVARQFTTDFAAGEKTKMQAIADLPARAVAFSTVQAIAGQSTGSTSYADLTTLDLVGEAAATLTVSAGGVSVQRETAASAASITWNVVDFGDDACN